MGGLFEKFVNRMPPKCRNELTLWYFSHIAIPLVGYVGPKIVEVTDTRVVIKVKLRRHTINHLKSMYFGALCTAADVAGGLVAMNYIAKTGKKVHLSFKNFHADFIKRAEGDTLFTNDQGDEILRFIDRAIESGERMEMPVHVVATVPDKFGNEPVAKFTLTVSVKCKS